MKSFIPQFMIPQMSLLFLIAGLLFNSPSLAVHMSSGGTGQVLLFPHYQATKTSYTTLSITNSKMTSKAIKLRFTHPETGEAVAIYNLYLSPGDMWQGQIKEDKNGTVQILTQDKSCLLVGLRSDLPKRGGLEVLEMATIKDLSVKDCDALSNAWNDDGPFGENPRENANRVLTPPTGGLFGRAEVVQDNNMFSFQPIALESWRDAPLHTSPSETKPDLSDVHPKVSIVTSGSGGFVTSKWENNHPASPVTALFMSSKLINLYQADSAKSDSTDFLISFPTKNFYNHNPCTIGKIKFYERPSSGNPALQDSLNLCSNSLVLSIHNDRVLGLADSLSTSQNVNPTDGQAHLELVGLQLSSDEGHIYSGLPVYSYSVFINRLLGKKSLPQVQSGSSQKSITLNSPQ